MSESLANMINLVTQQQGGAVAPRAMAQFGANQNNSLAFNPVNAQPPPAVDANGNPVAPAPNVNSLRAIMEFLGFGNLTKNSGRSRDNQIEDILNQAN